MILDKGFWQMHRRSLGDHLNTIQKPIATTAWNSHRSPTEKRPEHCRKWIVLGARCFR